MERGLEKYYTDFERPPFAPTYEPTEEEFADPIAYVAKIKPEAEIYGVVKIIPPATFRPPFQINTTTFEFTPRVQQLNQIDALFRRRLQYWEKLVNYWKLHGKEFRVPYIKDRYIDLLRVKELVDEMGGQQEVDRKKKWRDFARIIGFTPNDGPTIRESYTKWVYPMERSLQSLVKEEKKVKTPPPTRMRGASQPDAPQQPSTSAVEQSSPLRMSGRLRPMSMVNSTRDKPKPIPVKKTARSVEHIMCQRCGSGDDEAKLLLCDLYDRSYHMYCLDPKLNAVPKREWRCPKCVAEAVNNCISDFGFHESERKFNVESFGEFANNFKEQYFGQVPTTVPVERVEAEFWRNVVNLEKTVQVKYGADLFTSKVGSGFPRVGDQSDNSDSKEYQYYANHPWNLNNMPTLKQSVLSHIHTEISGMMVPWVYVGMCFSTFCWHVEDHWTYSVNYNHWGEPKIWYGIAGKDAGKFDECMRQSAPELFANNPRLLHDMATALSPNYLMERGIPVYTVHQKAGEFVITFPRAYHAGFNEGLNFAEAVNFAPPDWLHMGRLSLQNYAEVNRHCVFAHDELIMKMVSDADDMDITMCQATLEEVRYILKREKQLREQIAHKGLRLYAKCDFDKLPDDARACTTCCTTLFISALECACKRLFCLEHVQDLCGKCGVRDCCLKFKYELADFLPLVEKLTKRTMRFEEWRREAFDILESKLRLPVRKIREHIEAWKKGHYPYCDEFHGLMRRLKEFEQTSTSIGQILHRNIRLRDNTRVQKVDARCDYDELLSLRGKLLSGKVVDEILERSVERLYKQISDWRDRADEALIECMQQPVEPVIVEKVMRLIGEGDEFNVKLPEVWKLNSELVRLQWISKADKVVKWKSGFAKPANSDWHGFAASTSASSASTTPVIRTQRLFGEDVERFTLLYISDAISESLQWRDSCATVKSQSSRLMAMHARGTEVEKKVAHFFAHAAGVGLEKAEDFWRKEVSSSDWLDSDCLNELREEIELAEEISSTFAAMTTNDHRTSVAPTSLRSLNQLKQRCANSLLQSNSSLSKDIDTTYDQLLEFVKRIQNMFAKSTSYYNVFEILAGRDDLPVLTEGEPLPLELFNAEDPSKNWYQLKEFDNASKLTAHLKAVSDQQTTLMKALRAVNEKRPLKETCACAKDAGSDGIISCFLCRGRFHDECAQWEPFMQRLPPGMYLCPRCLRSRRPGIQDVEGACSAAPPFALEVMLTNDLIARAQSAFHELLKYCSQLPSTCDDVAVSTELKTKVEDAMLLALSVEVMDTEAYEVAFASAYMRLFPVPDAEVEVWRRIRDRAVTASPRRVLFAVTLPRQKSTPASSSSSRRAKRSSGATSTGGGAQPKRRYEKGEEDICAADGCLKPYSDQVRWIQCETGCGRWYHLVCVGLTVKCAKEIPAYCCYRCSASPSVSSTAVACN